jgi:methyl-accepting chemotaxis protein
VSTQAAAIQGAMQGQRESTKTVLDMITALNEISNDVKTSSTEMYEGSGQVRKESDNLEHMTGEINDAVREMDQDAGRIQDVIRQVNDLTIENKNSIGILRTEVQKFRIA